MNKKVTIEQIKETLKWDLKIYKRIIRNYKRNKEDITYGTIGIKDYLEALYFKEYIEFLLKEVFTGNIY